MNLLLLEPGEDTLKRSDPRARHIERVLHAGVGDTLRVGVVGKETGTASIREISQDYIRLQVDLSSTPPPLPPLELVLGHPRPIVLKRIIRDLAAIGVGRIIVVPTDLGEKSYYSSNMWQQVDSLLRDGASQGGTTRLPALTRAESLERALVRLVAGDVARLVLHPAQTAAVPSLHAALAERGAAPLALAIGSERGWSERELTSLEQHGFERVRLGPSILRTETATAIAAWSACEHLREHQTSLPPLS
ncbi:MAG: RsmE family RNA methyltransferase [Spirochaetota bacterium]